MAGLYDFTVYSGEDFNRTLTWSSSSMPVSEGGTPINLTGWTADLQLNGVDGFITTTSNSNGLITLGGALGTIKLQINKAIIEAFTVQVQSYRLFMTNTASITSCLLTGSLKIL